MDRAQYDEASPGIPWHKYSDGPHGPPRAHPGWAHLLDLLLWQLTPGLVAVCGYNRRTAPTCR